MATTAGWGSAFRSASKPIPLEIPKIFPSQIDLDKVVTIDFETYFSTTYTLRKLSTSSYIRDPQFKAHMMGLKIGCKPVRIIPGDKIREELAKIDWSTHYLLCHNTAFDGFILSHHYGVVPMMYLDTLSMARALHSNEISGKLNDVAIFYGVGNKIPNVLEQSKGFRTLSRALYKEMSPYCAEDVRLTFEIFKLMLNNIPSIEMDLIHITLRMFCEPVLKVDIPRVEKELDREIQRKESLLLKIVNADKAACTVAILRHGKEAVIAEAKKVLRSAEKFAELLRDEGIDPPTKISPRTGKVAYAFAKTDAEFIALAEHPSEQVRDLYDARLAATSNIDETRAGRFLDAGKNGWSLPVMLRYFGAHTGRWSAGNKMNMQNLRRGGELRLSILAPKGYMICVADSGQIEARVNAWLSGQEDMLEQFRGMGEGSEVDVYTSFASRVYNRLITKADKLERFVGKVGVLGLGYQMGAEKLQKTLALGLMGPPVHLNLDVCKRIVNTYRRTNNKIAQFWEKCEAILYDMSIGRTGSYKCISWEKDKLWLPNGICLKYPGLKGMFDPRRNKMGNWTYLRKGERTKIYGGLLCENIVQALARIIVGEQMHRIHQSYRVVMMTHDEVVTIAPTRSAKKCYGQMIKAMVTPLEWCRDLPLAAEGGFDVNYSK